MEVLKITGIDVEVDYPEELEPYMDRFDKVRIRGEKLQACSPFREEKHPSFAVNLENGSWVDSGADAESERKGSFISLLSHFRGETYEETAEYLLEKYSHILDDVETLKLELKLSFGRDEKVLGKEHYADEINKPSNYLRGRGIVDVIQEHFQTGIGRTGECVVLPWHDRTGRIINIKYRSTKGKKFWFIKDGKPIKQHVYGLFAVLKGNYTKVWAVESEIDCLYLWSNGIPAVAFGGASINDTQKNLILNSCIENLVIATDNDAVGKRFGQVLAEEFAGYLGIEKLLIPEGIKDVNELTTEQLFGSKKESLKLSVL